RAGDARGRQGGLRADPAGRRRAADDRRLSGRTMTASTSPKTCPGSELAESFDPFTEPYLGDPYAFWRIAREQAPVFYSPRLDYWIVSRFDDVRDVFQDTDTFSASISI